MPHATKKFDEESFESLLKRFKKAVEKAGVIQEFRNREYYEKPSLIRKRKKAAAVKRAQRLNEEEKQYGHKRPIHQKKEKKKQDLMDEQKYS